MKARLIRIGNSRGVRLPKVAIEQARLEEEVDLHVRDGAVILSSRRRPRAGWAKAARSMVGRRGHRLLDQPAPTSFDDAEWHWR